MARLSLKIWLGTEGSETGVRKVYVMESFLREGKSGFYGVTPMEDHDKAVIIEFLSRCVDYSDKSIERKR